MARTERLVRSDFLKKISQISDNKQILSMEKLLFDNTLYNYYEYPSEKEFE